MSWQPLSKRSAADRAEAYAALSEGIPSWLESSVRDWAFSVMRALSRSESGGSESGRQRVLLQSIERKLKVEVPWGSHLTSGQQMHAFLDQALGDEEQGLDLVDLLLTLLGGLPGTGGYARELETALKDAGSAWKVAEDCRSLQRRVDQTIGERAARLAGGSSRVGTHLRQAWSAMYGREPNPGHAYREAVKAVEVAAIPVVCPSDAAATLGRIIGQVRANPRKFKVELHPAGELAPIQVVLSMLDLLWKGQRDRHGTPDPAKPATVTSEEAEAAVHLALTLSQWFQCGTIGVS